LGADDTVNVSASLGSVASSGSADAFSLPTMSRAQMPLESADLGSPVASPDRSPAQSPLLSQRSSAAACPHCGVVTSTLLAWGERDRE
jgi:hypothetical protein